MAAAVISDALSRRGLDALVISAGTDGPAGRPATDQSIDVMDQVGIDLRQHRSRLIDAGDIDCADLILVMTRAHQKEMSSRSTTAYGRVFVLGELARLVGSARPASAASETTLEGLLEQVAARRAPVGGHLASDEIVDPFGRSTETYRAIRDRMMVDAAVIAQALAVMTLG